MFLKCSLFLVLSFNSSLLLRFVSGNCITDYTGPCPEGFSTHQTVRFTISGWNLSFHSSEVCTAPLSYHGPCSSEIISVNNKSDKLILESHCKIKWPCLEICDRDLNRCPRDWFSSKGLCVPSSSYRGNCNFPISLSSMEMTQKIVWSMKCGVRFFCKKSCSRDYSRPCPQDWKLVDGNCEAPPDYSGPCHSIANLSFFSSKMKEDFETVCNVLYPCKSQ